MRLQSLASWSAKCYNITNSLAYTIIKDRKFIIYGGIERNLERNGARKCVLLIIHSKPCSKPDQFVPMLQPTTESNLLHDTHVASYVIMAL